MAYPRMAETNEKAVTLEVYLVGFVSGFVLALGLILLGILVIPHL